VIAARLVEHDHVERRGRGALFLVAADVKTRRVRACVEQLVHAAWIAVEREHDVRRFGEQLDERGVGHAVRMLARREQFHQIHDVDHADVQRRCIRAQPRRGCEHLECRHVAGGREHDIGLAVVVARPLPDRRAARAVLRRGREVEPLQLGLLVDDDEVDVVATAQAVVGDREQAVRIGRQVDARDAALLRRDRVHEARALMREAVVVVAPARRRQEIVERRHRRAPRQVLGHLEPLRVLRGHRRDDQRERLVRREQAVAAGQHVALEPALAVVLAQHLHHATLGRDVIVDVDRGLLETAVLDLEHRAEPVGVGLVGANQPERRRVGDVDVAQELAERARRLVDHDAGRRHRHRVVRERGDRERAMHAAAVRVRVRAHAARAGRRQRAQVRREAAAIVEQLLGTVAMQPRLERRELDGIRAHRGQRDLVRAERALDGQPVHDLRAGPALRRPHHDRGPARRAAHAGGPRRALDRGDAHERRIERRGERLVHAHRLVALDEQHLVAMALEEAADRRVGGAAEHGWTGDLVAVQVKDRQHRAIARGIEELDALPRALERAGLRLAIADDRHRDQRRIVEHRAERVGQDVAELAALVNRARRRRADVARHAARRRELAEQPVDAGGILADLRIDLGVRALEVHVRQDRRAAVARSREVDDVEVIAADQPVEVSVDEALARGCAPVAK
jgi:hypothetical protein